MKRKKGLSLVSFAFLTSVILIISCSSGGGGNNNNNNNNNNGGGTSILSQVVRLARVKMAANFPDGSNLATGYVNITFLSNLTGRKIINVAVDLNGDGKIAAYAVGADTQEEWVVQNMPARVDTSEPNRFNFAFYDAAADARTNLTGTAVLTEAPIEVAAWDGAVPAVKLESMQFTVASVGQVTTSYTMNPEVDTGFAFAAFSTAVSLESKQEASAVARAGGNYTAFHGGVPDIRQRTNECVPTSAANNLRWLAQTHGYNDKLPATNIEMIDILKVDLKWNNGVKTAVDFMPGKEKFCKDRDLPIETHQVGTKRDLDVAAKIREELDKGQAIEMTMSFYKKTGPGLYEREGGHMVTLVGVFKNSTGTYVDLHDPDTDTFLDTYKIDDTTFADELDLASYNPPLFTTIEYAFAQSPKTPPPPPPPPVCAPLGDVFIPTATVSYYDPSSHYYYTGDPFKNNTLHFTNDSAGNITITGAAPFVTVSGVVNSNCTFIATGSGTVAGRPNVTVTMDGDLSGGVLTGEYSMGAGGELPGGNPIIFTYSGDL